MTHQHNLLPPKVRQSHLKCVKELPKVIKRRVGAPGSSGEDDHEAAEQGERGGPGGRRRTDKRSDQPARLVEGQRVMGWREALSELDIAYPGRLR